MVLTALAVYELHGHGEALTRDLGIYTYAGQQLLEGEPPYQGILNRAGPLAHVFPAVGVAGGRLLGVGDVLGARVFFMLLAVATVWAVYRLCRDLFDSRAVALAGAAAMLSFHGFIHYAAQGPREKTPMVLFLVLCLWALHRRQWFWAGLWLSLATLLLQIVFPVGAGTFVVAWLATSRGDRLRSLGKWVGGGLVPVAAFAVYFAIVGTLADAARAFLLINAQYTVADIPLNNLPIIWNNLVYAYGWSLGLLLLGGAVVIAAVVRAWRTRGQTGQDAGCTERSRSVTLAAYGGGLIVFLLWCARDFDGWPDAFPALPVAAIGIAVLVHEVRDRIPVRSDRFAVGVVVGSLVVTVASGTWAYTNRFDSLDEQRALSLATLRDLPADATFFSVEAPQPLVHGQRSSVSRLQTFAGGLDRYVEDNYPGGLRGLAEDVAEQRTTVIFARDDEPLPTWLAPTLEEEYVEVTESRFRTFLHQSVDASTRRAVDQEVRDAIRRVESS